MATERLPMQNIREILRLKWTLRRSHRETARSLGISAGAVAWWSPGRRPCLSGNVHSWAERQEAERAAWAAPGVTQVDDRLAVVP